MPRANADKATTSFLAGFVTEANGLTFPENSVQDIDNLALSLDGAARRRLGLNEEAGGKPILADKFVAQTGSVLAGPWSRLPLAGETSLPDELAITVHLWPQPGSTPGLNLVCIQLGNFITFRNWDSRLVSDPNELANLLVGDNSFNIADATAGFVFGTSHILASKSQLQSSSGFGRLWLSSESHHPFYAEYDSVNKTITLRPVGHDPSKPETVLAGSLTIRDFNGVEDGLEPNEKPAVITSEHEYNLQNQGWGSTSTIVAIQRGTFPSNAEQLILGRNSTGDFDVPTLSKQEFGNSLAPRGRVILHALSGQRSGLAKPDGLGGTFNIAASFNEPSTTSFSTVSFYAGRVWFAGDSNQKRPNGVYFSKTLSKTLDAGVLRSENDPTSEHFSDVLATDGGVVYITEASRIIKLQPYSNGILAFATNGVWFISGGAGESFTATAFSVDKISDIGCISASSVVVSEQAVFFFSETSILAMALPEQGRVPVIQDIGYNKVFTFYGRIPREARVHAHGGYDQASKKVVWSFLDLEQYEYPSGQSQFNRMLILDTRTGAFTKYSFACDDDVWNGPLFTKRSISRPLVLENITVMGVPATVGGEPLVGYIELDETRELFDSVKVLSTTATGVRILEFYDAGFFDYATMAQGATDYSAYLVSADETLGDIQRFKSATYIHSFFKKTETGVRFDSGGNLIYRNGSGAQLQAQWDWHISAAGGRWSMPQRAYRFRTAFVASSISDPVDIGEGIVYTKLKIRGKGRSLAVRYDADSGKDMQLLGYSIAFTANEV
jgi:hypothetical protein